MMNPCWKSFDHRSKCLRLIPNCIVVALSKSENGFNSTDQSLHSEEYDKVRAHSWPDNRNRPISPAALSVHSNEAGPFLPLAKDSPQPKSTSDQIDGWTLFNQFIDENSTCIWNPYLVGSLAQLQFKGFLYPSSLLIGGTEFSQEVIRSAWSKRILKAPQGYEIDFIGDISFIESTVVFQAQFTPLAEALCKCINELNARQINATFSIIVNKLQSEFPNMELPSDEILKNSLKTLVQEKKLHYNSQQDCFVAYSAHFDNSLEDIQSLSLKNHHLMTSEEVFTRLHGKQHFGSDESCSSRRSWSLQVNDNVQNTSESLESSCVTHKTDNNSDNNSNIQTNSSLRRSASLRIEAHKTNSSADENKCYTFNRSKSFKLNRGKHDFFSQQECNSRDALKNKIEPFKKQSVFSKLLRIGNGGNSAKSKAYHYKHSNFSSQFPEINENSESQLFNKNTGKTKCKSTQTIKCGGEDSSIAALIIKQASRHALAKNRYNNNNDYICWNKVCCCCNYCDAELDYAKYSRHCNKPLIAYKCAPAIELQSSPHQECNLCNTEINTLNSSNYCRHDNANNNNCWQNSGNDFRESSPNKKVNKRVKNIKQLDYYNSLINKRPSSPSASIYTQSKEHKELLPQKLMLDSNKTQEIHANNSIHQKDTKIVPAQVSNNTISLNNQKEKQYRIMQSASSTQISPQTQEINDPHNKIMLDNSFNVKIEIGSSTSASTNGLLSNIRSAPNHKIKSYHNGIKNISSSGMTSFPISHELKAEHMESQDSHPLMTSATTVTTSMTIPNFYNNNNNNNNNNNYSNKANVPQEADVENMKILKPNNDTNRKNLLYNNNNKLRIESVPHLSPIRQKVARAKAEFFNSPSSHLSLAKSNLI